MRKFVFALMLATPLSVAAAADHPFIGQWTRGDTASCASDALTMFIRERTIEQHEELCRITSMRKISKLADSGYRVHLVCKPPGAAYATDVVLALMQANELHGPLLVSTDLTTGIVRTYQRCPRSRNALLQ